ETARLLLKAGADVDVTCWKGLTALIKYVINDLTAVVEFLLDYGANYHVIDKDGNSILHLAARYSGADTIRKLIDADLHGLDVEAKNHDGWSAQELATQKLNHWMWDDDWDKEFSKLIYKVRHKTDGAQ